MVHLFAAIDGDGEMGHKFDREHYLGGGDDYPFSSGDAYFVVPQR